MSHEIQLMNPQQNPNNLPAMPMDWHDASTALSIGGGGAPPASPVKKLQRLLRGRFMLAGVLGLICAVTGAIFGYASQSPKFSSSGIVWIKPVIPAIMTSDKVVPFYDKFV